jgi:hypothetical protein
MEKALADDILDGIKAISEFLGQSERRTYYLAEKGLLDGVFKQGNRWVGLKSAMREGYARRSKGAMMCILPSSPDEKVA